MSAPVLSATYTFEMQISVESLPSPEISSPAPASFGITFRPAVMSTVINARITVPTMKDLVFTNCTNVNPNTFFQPRVLLLFIRLTNLFYEYLVEGRLAQLVLYQRDTPGHYLPEQGVRLALHVIA